MEVVVAASSSQGSDFRRSQAIAQVVETLARRLASTEEQQQKLADLLTSICPQGALAPASGPAEGGGGAMAVSRVHAAISKAHGRCPCGAAYSYRAVHSAAFRSKSAARISGLSDV